jgi:hypothetical protein
MQKAPRHRPNNHYRTARLTVAALAILSPQSIGRWPHQQVPEPYLPAKEIVECHGRADKVYRDQARHQRGPSPVTDHICTQEVRVNECGWPDPGHGAAATLADVGVNSKSAESKAKISDYIPAHGFPARMLSTVPQTCADGRSFS